VGFESPLATISIHRIAPSGQQPPLKDAEVVCNIPDSPQLLPESYYQLWLVVEYYVFLVGMGGERRYAGHWQRRTP